MAAIHAAIRMNLFHTQNVGLQESTRPSSGDFSASAFRADLLSFLIGYLHKDLAVSPPWLRRMGTVSPILHL